MGARNTTSRIAWLTVAAAAALAGCGSDEDQADSAGGQAGTALGGSGGASTGGAGGASGASGGSAGAGGSSGAGGTGGGAGGKIIVAPGHPQWLAYEGGGSFYLCAPGDPEGFLYRGTRNADGTREGDQAALIAKLAPTGANGIYMMAVRSHGGDGGPEENPFVDSDPAKGLSSPILDQWEQWLTSMDAAGIVAYFFFYDDSASIWDTGDTVGPQEQAFVEGLVDRFEHHDHLIWVVAEEYSERFTKARASALAAAIRAADDRDHVIAIHQLDGLTFDFPNDPNIDQFAIQYNVPTSEALHDGMVNAWSDAAGRYNLNMAEAADHGGGSTARRKNWAIAMGGAYVMALGWDIATTPVEDLVACGHLRRFMESTSFEGMEPHDELARNATDYVLASPGDSYIAYAAGAGDLGLASMAAGNYTLRWFDAIDGTEVQHDVSLGSGDQTLTRPPGLGDEIAVYIQRH